MSFLNVTDYNANEAVEKDVVGGGSFKLLPSNIYDFTINHAYFSKSAKSESKSLVLELESEATGKRRFTLWVTNKNGQIKTKNDKGELKYVAGFLLADALCLLTVGKPLVEIDKLAEKKTIMLYNWEARAEVATDVLMLMPLIKQKIKAAVLERISNKQTQNQSTGKWEDTADKRSSNEIVKFLRHRDDLTVNEIRARSDKPKFRDDWLAQWEGKADDRYKEVAGPAGTAGAPGGAFAGGAEPAGTTGDQDNLFM